MGVIMKHIPNILSSIRLLLVPVFPLVYFSNSKEAQTYALIVFLVASITDLLDGYIARKFQLITKIGTVLDPLADKTMQIAVLISLYIGEALPLWILVAFLAKELFMITSGTILYWRKEKMVIPSHFVGKAATVVMAIALTLLIIFPANIWCILVAVLAFTLKLSALSIYIYHYRRKTYVVED